MRNTIEKLQKKIHKQKLGESLNYLTRKVWSQNIMPEIFQYTDLDPKVLIMMPKKGLQWTNNIT